MKKLTTLQFIEKARKIYGDKFNYLKSNYSGSFSKIIVTCPKHGDIEKTPSNFFRTGCYGCYLDGLKESRLTLLERKNREKEQNKKYRTKNLEKIKILGQKYYINNKEILKNQRFYNLTHKKEIKDRQKQYNLIHKKEINYKQKQYNLKHKDQLLKKSKEYHVIHAEQIRERKRKYYLNNREKIRAKAQDYQLKREKASYRKYIREYHKERRKRDVNFMLRHKIRNRIYMALCGNYKSDRTIDLLGCSMDQLKEHLNFTAYRNGYKKFDINNFKGKQWHIDHVIPCCTFDLSNISQQKICFNYKNPQILSAKDNMTKNRN